MTVAAPLGERHRTRRTGRLAGASRTAHRCLRGCRCRGPLRRRLAVAAEGGGCLGPQAATGRVATWRWSGVPADVPTAAERRPVVPGRPGTGGRVGPPRASSPMRPPRSFRDAGPARSGPRRSPSSPLPATGCIGEALPGPETRPRASRPGPPTPRRAQGSGDEQRRGCRSGRRVRERGRGDGRVRERRRRARGPRRPLSVLVGPEDPRRGAGVADRERRLEVAEGHRQGAVREEAVDLERPLA